MTATAEYKETIASINNLIPIDTYTAKEGRREIKIELDTKPTAEVKVVFPNRLQSPDAVLLLDDISNKNSTDRKGAEPSNQVELTFRPENWNKTQSIYVGQELFDLDSYYEGNWNIPVQTRSEDKRYNKKETIRINSVFTPETKGIDWSQGAKENSPLISVREQNGKEDVQLFQKEGAGVDNYKRFEVVHSLNGRQRAAIENFRVVVKTQEIEIEKIHLENRA